MSSALTAEETSQLGGRLQKNDRKTFGNDISDPFLYLNTTT